jgi:hypothetical protein
MLVKSANSPDINYKTPAGLGLRVFLFSPYTENV